MSVKSNYVGGGGGAIVRCGYLKKLKTSRKKWFVLRDETCDTSAKLEYYDSEKKFNNGQHPKRSIPLKTCFNINKRSDTKHKHVIALYTKDDCFCVVLESEEELESWLKALLSLQHGEEITEGETPRPTFEHVWQVKILNRGLGGTSLLCGGQKIPEPLDYRLCLMDKTLSLVPKDPDNLQIELALSNIRSCGSLKNYVCIEVGRSSSIGSGELWLDADDTNIAQNVHQTVYHAMTTSGSSSREDLNFQRPRSTSESSKQNAGIRRPKTTSFNQDTPHSNDSLANPVPATSSTTRTNAGGVTCPGIVSHQRTQSLPLAHPAPLTDHTSHPPRAAKRSNQSSKCYNGSGRERCDSMPSRPRTTSEGNHPVPFWNPLRVHQGAFRPHTICIRDISHSPPSGSPISPPSANCSTDSAGSSLSIDESEPWPEGETMVGRYSNSLTPDEAIAEIDEHPDSPLYHSHSPSSYVPMNPISSDDGYVDMSPGGGRHVNMSPAASISSVTSGTPSTDLRFAEYHLEKVTSYLTPSEEDETGSTDRPIRAYSVGSRPEYACYRTRPELSSTPENSRARAFSVGSKSKKNHHNRVLPPHSVHPHHGTKSSSAPILSNSRLNSWMNDHMELDFSKRNLSNSGYVEMRAGNKVNEGYVEMKPGKIPETSPYVDMRGGSSPAKNSFLSLHHDNFPYIDGVPNNMAKVAPQDVARNDYVDMTGRNNKKSSPPATRNQNTHQSGYMDMNFHNRRNDPHHFSVISPVKTFNHGSPINSMDYMEMDNSRVSEPEPRQTPDGYVEMTLGPKVNHQRQSSLENPDYANMNCGKKSAKTEKGRSQPITIQTTVSSPAYTVVRKFSTGTPPKMYLPLSGGSPFSSLPRQKTRRDSKDSSSSSVTTTPSSSSTIFPISINSPSSPVKPQSATNIAAIANIKYKPTRANSEDYIMMDFEKNKKQPDTSEYVNFNPAAKPATAPIAKDEFDDYAIMKPGKADAKPKPLGFRPISESKDDLTASSPRPGDVAPEEAPPYNRSESVNSEKARTRPGSTTSELGSSTSTIVGSRPSSVNSEQMRPASVSSEVQLHYASLDLAKAEEEGGTSPRATKQAEGEPATGFTYAEIDFIKSEQNARVKH